MEQSHDTVDKQTEFASEPTADFSAFNNITELVETYQFFADTNDPSAGVMQALQKRCVELIIMKGQEEARDDVLSAKDETYELAAASGL